MLNNNIYILLIIGSIFFIIGLPTFLLGCNPSISDKCISYNIFIGNIYKTEVYEKTCSKCVKKNKKGYCERYNKYICWDAYVYARHINNNNQTTSSCILQTAESYNSEYSAERSTQKYKIDENVKWFKKKISKNCETNNKVIVLWYTGVVFLSLTGFVILISLIIFIFVAIKQIINYKINDVNKNNEENVSYTKV